MTACPHTMKRTGRNGVTRCCDCGKLLPKPPKPKTFRLKGAAAHKFLRLHDPTFPLHPDEMKE